MSVFASDTGVEVAFESVGAGTPIIALHGAYSAREEMREALEPILGPLHAHRRIYPDLPGMGDSPPHPSIRTTRDVVDVLDELIRIEIGQAPFLLLGHSYGGHVARGLTARRAGQVAGLALICPLMPATMNSEAHAVAAAGGDPAEWLEESLVDEYTSYFVIHTQATAARFRRAVVPVIGRYDGDLVNRVMTDWAHDPDPNTMRFDNPTLVVTARHDAFVGYRDQAALLDQYPRASYVVVADAGHALPHEHPDLLAALIGDWLARCSSPTAAGR